MRFFCTCTFLGRGDLQNRKDTLEHRPAFSKTLHSRSGRKIFLSEYLKFINHKYSNLRSRSVEKYKILTIMKYCPLKIAWPFSLYSLVSRPVFLWETSYLYVDVPCAQTFLVFHTTSVSFLFFEKFQQIFGNFQRTFLVEVP